MEMGKAKFKHRGFKIIGLLLLLATYHLIPPLKIWRTGNLSSVFAANNAGDFLRNGVGARALGMGNAYVAMTDDATCGYFNPASLGILSERCINTMYADKFNLGIEYSYFAVGIPLKNSKLGGFALSYIQQGVRDIEKSTQLDINMRPIISGSFDDIQSAVILSYGKLLKSNISAGGNVKFIRHKLDAHSADGFGMDVGVLYKKQKLSAGMVIQDLTNTRISWDTGHSDTIPLTLRTGAGYRQPVKRYGLDEIRVSLDMIKRENRALEFNEGLELWFIDIIGIRAGMRDSKFSAGASVRYKFIQIDYAYTTHTLGDTQYFSIGGKF